ncbi:peptidase [Aliidiomarina minuta]|uniref:Peptidase n=1 Tax=Aliidiomarina minuta TaxID=880057 RepID=A0A432W5H0_9GAMM|nr:M14 family metallocarboxypeptidase [Aliidiomarina minuta]RUO25318.1 peptidase [Aliidiomarina minuta]
MTEATHTAAYKIGTPGKPWGAQEKAEWLAEQKIQRSYADDVLQKIKGFEKDFSIEQYASLEYEQHGAKRYPLFIVKNRDWDNKKPTVLVTGGVHGYETSGVHGALRFIETQALQYAKDFNILVVPCISPWGYETINRWTPLAVDPNRSFVVDSPAEEAASVMAYLAIKDIKPDAHIDLHETTDTDNSEFRPALAARDGITNSNWNIPDGFYLVGDSENLQPEFQKAVLQSVSQVTHIAEADEQGQLIGAKTDMPGLISFPTKKLGLCIGLSDAAYVTTTEVYPDSAKATAEECIQAQVAAVTGALNFLQTALR